MTVCGSAAVERERGNYWLVVGYRAYLGNSYGIAYCNSNVCKWGEENGDEG